MEPVNAALWGIILAGGEGQRLKEFVWERFGTDAPKQFCAFFGRRTMIEHTVKRAETIIPRERLVVVATAQHREHVFHSLAKQPPGTILFQPVGRDTAPGVLLPLVHILNRDPDAIVAILPSDHFIDPGRRFMDAIAEAADFLVRTRAESLIVLAVEPTDAEPDYGWLEPGLPISSDGPPPITRINRFVEKPSPSHACELMAEGWLWNTMVIVARAQSLMNLAHETMPELASHFSVVQSSIGTQRESEILDEIYRMIPSVNFSSAVLANRPEDLMVLPVRNVRWSDWGRRERILQTLTGLGASQPLHMPGAADVESPPLMAS